MRTTMSLLLRIVLLTMSVAAEAAQDGHAPQEHLYSRDEIASDLDALYRGLQSGSFDLYAFTPKATLDRLYAQLRKGPDHPLTLTETRAYLQVLAAAAHQGHARVDGPYADWAAYRKTGGKGFPLNVRIVEDRMYVAENLSAIDTIRRGDEILSINSSPASRWLERVSRHVSAETPYMAHSILEYDFPIYLWVEAGTLESFDVELRGANGKRYRLRVPARTGAEMKQQRAAEPAQLDLEHPLREAKILPKGVAYLRPGPFYNAEAKTGAEEWDVGGFKDFIDSAFRRFEASKADRLIIDLRGNPGGDSLFSDVMTAWIADRPFRFYSEFKIKVSAEAVAANDSRIEHDAAAAGPVSRQYRDLYAHAKPGDIVDYAAPLTAPRAGGRFVGKVFVLVDRHSYSNAVAVAATIQDYKFGTILGETTADMATTYGAMEQFKLPNSGLSAGFPKARIVRPDGDQRSRGVAPDVAIPMPIVQTSTDEVLQTAVDIALRH